jgi:hypothetical protein
VFESSEQPTSLSIKPYRRLKARLYVDGVDMQMLFFTLEKVKDFYEGRVYGSNADFFNFIKDRKLADLDLNYLNHHWDYNTVIQSRFNDTGYIYALINWNVEDTGISDADREQCERLLVGVYAETLLNEICSQAGYTLVNTLLNDTDYNAQSIYVASGAKDYVRDNINNRYIGASYDMLGFADDSIAQAISFVNLLNENEIFFENQNPSTGSLRFEDMIRLKWKIDFKIYNTTGSDKTIYLNAAYYDNTGNFSSYEVIEIIVPNTGAVTPYEVTIANQDAYILTGAKKDLPNVFFSSPNIGFDILNIYSGVYANNLDAVFTILEAEMIEEEVNFDGLDRNPNEIKPILYDADNQTGILPKEFDYVTVANLLPDITQASFFKDFLLLHGGVLQVNEQNKTITLSKFETVKNNLANAVDWSGKLDFIENNTTEFRLDYAQNNNLKYADEDGVIKPTGTDAVLIIDDENLEFEKDFITLDFGASESGQWFDNQNQAIQKNFPNIKVLEGGLVTEQVTPRVLYLKKIDGYYHTYRDGNTQTDIITAAPITWFIDTTQSNNLGFDNSLFANYYSFLEGILNRTKVIECLLRLNTSDIATFDFLKPVYIKELDGYFYVSKIKFDYTSNASSVCELVKLL